MAKSPSRVPAGQAAAENVKFQKRLNRAVARVENLMLRGGGAGVAPSDRGAGQSSQPVQTMHPYDMNNFLWRYQEYTRWYFKTWECRKIVDIPCDDAFRIPFRLTGLPTEETKALRKDWDKLNSTIQFRRGLKQHRLLGGSALYMRLADAEMDDRTAALDKPVDMGVLGRNPRGVEAFNLIDIDKIHHDAINNDPLSRDYDRPTHYLVAGTRVHSSRLIMFDGEPIFNRQNANVLQLGHVNPSGFGESVLCQIYDDLIRVTGTREGAYHLVNMASVLLACVKDYKLLMSTKPGEAAAAVTAEVINLINLYRAAIVDAENIEIKQHAASFGSVPELVMVFLQILSAAADIPATRFLGQSPGGLNATGDSDLENYYNMIDAWQEEVIKARMLKAFDVIGVCRFGLDGWAKRREHLDIEYPPLWNLKQTEQATIAQTLINAFKPLLDAKVMTSKQLEDELKARRVFLTPVELKEMIEKPPENPMAGPGDQPPAPGGGAGLPPQVGGAPKKGGAE